MSQKNINWYWSVYLQDRTELHVLRALNWIFFAIILSVKTEKHFMNVIWVELEKFRGNFALKFAYLFILQWRCVDKLTDFFFSCEKVMATKLGTMIVTGRYTIFRNDKWCSPFAEHCECMVFIGVLLATHLLFKDSQQKWMDDHSVWFAASLVERKLSKLCSCPLTSFYELTCTGKWKVIRENFPFYNL